MNFSWIECFLETARLGNFTKAAQALFLTQQTVSKYVIYLERYLGAELFDRAGTPLALTEAGRYFQSVFSASMSKLRLLSESVSDHPRAPLSLGCSEYIEPLGAMGRAVRGFAKTGAAKLRYLAMPNPALMEGLLDGSLDAVLISGGQLTQRSGMEAVAVAREELCLFGPGDMVGESLGPEAKKRREALPYLIREGQRSRFETSAFCSQELESMAYRPASIRAVPNIAAMKLEMERLRGIAISDRRFGALAAIPGLGAEPLGEESYIYCCFLSSNDNPGIPRLTEYLKTALA